MNLIIASFTIHFHALQFVRVPVCRNIESPDECKNVIIYIKTHELNCPIGLFKGSSHIALRGERRTKSSA